MHSLGASGFERATPGGLLEASIKVRALLFAYYDDQKPLSAGRSTYVTR